MNRRGRGEGGVYQRGDGKWVAALNLGIVDGRRRRKVLYGRTRAEAVRKLETAKRDHAASALVMDSPTVEKWLRYWRDEIAGVKLRPSTMKGYTTYIEQHLIPRVGHHRLDRLEPRHVRELYADMRRAGLAEASIRQAHAILSRALKVAEREGKVSRNVTKLVDPPDTLKHPRTPLTVHQARLVLKAAEGDPFESRWYAALWLGMRQGEVLGLSWADVHLNEGAIYISRALQRVKGKGLVFVEPKSASSIRRIPLPPVVASHLRVHWARHVDAGGALAGLVWPTSPERDSKAWATLLRKAEVPHVALHAARNTAGSLLMAAGVPTKIVTEILGHSTVQVTETHYLQGDVEQQTKAMLALEQYAG